MNTYIITLSYLTLLDRLDKSSAGDILLTRGDGILDFFIALLSSTLSRPPESAGETFPLTETGGEDLVCGPWNELVGEIVGWV